MHRFFVPPEWLAETPVSLTGPLAHQLIQVLRLRPGEEIALLDDTGREWGAEIAAVQPGWVTVHLGACTWPQTEAGVRIVICQALPREKKMDWVLQKGTELGVAAFVPVLTDRCALRQPARVDEGRMARWRAIVREAAEQSGRVRLPKVAPVQTFAQACEALGSGERAFIASVQPEAIPLVRAMASRSSPPTEIRLFVGPEGGFTSEELRLAGSAGIAPVSLGPRTLRTETAALVAVTIILQELGELEA